MSYHEPGVRLRRAVIETSSMLREKAAALRHGGLGGTAPADEADDVPARSVGVALPLASVNPDGAKCWSRGGFKTCTERSGAMTGGRWEGEQGCCTGGLMKP